jgi:multiple sugar transport system permease protein/putative chitobiose transport system permease protein
VQISNIEEKMRLVSKSINWIFIILITLICITPFVWIWGSSFKPEAEIFSSFYPLSIHTFIPIKFTFQNFIEIFKTINFGRNILNSLIVAVSVTSAVLFINSLAAFAFARIRFPGREFFFIVLISTMFIPFEVSMLPMYFVSKNLGLYNSYGSMIIPWIGQPFGIFLLRQFFLNIPRDLEDAAIIDGCSTMGIYRHVIIPNSKPPFITLGLIQFLWSWDAFFWPLIIVEDTTKQVIQVALASMMDPEYLRWGWLFAAVAISSTPIILIFFFLQKYYVKGLALSGLKS